MTFDTVRGCIGITKQLYLLSANEMSSLDIAIFIDANYGNYDDVATSIKQTRVDAELMKAELLAQMGGITQMDITAYAWLYPAWMDYLDYHLGIVQDVLILTLSNLRMNPNCLQESQKSPLDVLEQLIPDPKDDSITDKNAQQTTSNIINQ